ncbi:aminopeptidase P family N-terminal domain-containing protein, partial [Sinorhizobium meliloti]
MFQSFEVTSTPQFGKERTTALRAALATLGVDGFLVPRADEFQGEYVPRSSERLSWLTGFTGSAGVALVTQREAIVFVDGRYVTQLKEQVDGSVFTGGDLIGEPPHVWLERHGPKGFRLGIDPWLHTAAEVRRLEKALAAIGGSVVLLDHNPLDRLWTDRPATPLGPVTIQPVEHAGQLAKDKIAEIAAGVAKAKAAAVVLTDPSSVAWTFNIRG